MKKIDEMAKAICPKLQTARAEGETFEAVEDICATCYCEAENACFVRDTVVNAIRWAAHNIDTSPEFSRMPFVMFRQTIKDKLTLFVDGTTEEGRDR